MGTAVAISIAQDVKTEDISLEQGINYHLINNHYPPIVNKLVHKAALTAIENGNKGDWDKVIRIEHANGIVKTPTTAELIDALHLEPFIKGE